MMLKRNKGVSVTIYTYDKSKIFELDLQKYNAQYADCPIEILPNTNTHDRFLFIDETSYHFGASLKDLGKKTFFCSKEDFTLEEVLKETQNKRIRRRLTADGLQLPRPSSGCGFFLL